MVSVCFNDQVLQWTCPLVLFCFCITLYHVKLNFFVMQTVSFPEQFFCTVYKVVFLHYRYFHL